MSKTRIEWATHTWNPVTGCTPVSEGCENCYAARMAKRLAGRGGYPAEDPFRPGIVHSDKLEDPYNLRKRARYFVSSMGDLFHEDVSDDTINGIMHTVIGCDRHIFMILTKRPERMREYITSRDFVKANLWLGVTCENQARADERIPILLQTPAAVRFVSIEPMLGPVDFEKYFARIDSRGEPSGLLRDSIDWIICGGETGPGARPMHPDWVRSLRDLCLNAFTPFFFKSRGEWTTELPQGLSLAHREMRYVDKTTYYRVGKKLAGDALDGEQWHQIPDGK